jgi:hypothetical protein
MVGKQGESKWGGAWVNKGRVCASKLMAAVALQHHHTPPSNNEHYQG